MCCYQLDKFWYDALHQVTVDHLKSESEHRSTWGWRQEAEQSIQENFSSGQPYFFRLLLDGSPFGQKSLRVCRSNWHFSFSLTNRINGMVLISFLADGSSGNEELGDLVQDRDRGQSQCGEHVFILEKWSRILCHNSSLQTRLLTFKSPMKDLPVYLSTTFKMIFTFQIWSILIIWIRTTCLVTTI